MQAPLIPSGLPEPDAESARHSGLVRDYIAERIDACDGEIPFGEFMHYALYAPGLGYYVSGTEKFAGGGDFTTAPEISTLFGRVVARQCAPVIRTIRGASVLELGAGSAALAVDVLKRLRELDALPDQYLILEISPDLAERQRQRIAKELPDLAARVRWIDGLPADFDGVIIANEVADALPVERFRVAEGGIEQAFVARLGNGFGYRWGPATPALRNGIDEFALDLPKGYRSEVSLGLKTWTGELLDTLREGLVLLFDYGLTRREYYAADRDGGWIRCHYRHRAHNEPLILPGIQDITAWVDFTAIAEAASDHRAHVAGFVTQAMFMLAGGVEDEVASLAAPGSNEQLAIAGQLKRLVLPGEMGENFKCIGLTRGEVPVPSALSGADRSAAL